MPEPTRAQQLTGDFAPKLADLTDEVLFGDIWTGEGLSPRDQSLATIAALVMGGNTEQLVSRIGLGLSNGVTEAEFSETLTRLAFDAGWPKALSAVAVARKVLDS